MTVAVPMLRRFALLPLLAWLAACQLFAPAYDLEVGTRTSEAYTAVSQLMSEAEFGKFTDRASFEAVIDRYAQIDALLLTASASAGVLPTSAKPAEKARVLLVRQIESCRQRVRTVATIHKREGIQPDSGATENARIACDVASRAANAMKP